MPVKEKVYGQHMPQAGQRPVTKAHLKNGPHRKKTCLHGLTNNKGADQPAHPRRLISAFVIRFLDSIISKLATSEISIF